MVIQGIIRPPPEIRAVADRTALFVSKNGRIFEQRILNSDKGKTPKFAFLSESSPFHAYYEDRIRFYEEGGVDEDEGDKAEEEEAKKEEEAKAVEETKKQQQQVVEKKIKASAIDPIARALLAQRAKITQALEQKEEEKTEKDEAVAAAAAAAAATEPLAPPPFCFVTIPAPSNVKPVQIEIIKLVAQFTAMNHEYSSTSTFLRELTQREWNNPLFGFLQPRNGHFAYFTALVDAYRRLITLMDNKKRTNDDEAHVIMLSKDQSKKEQCLNMAAYRTEYERYRRDKIRKEEEELAQDGNGGISTQAANIDWHDFVVVETIDFSLDEVIIPEPPPPPPPLPTPAAKKEDDMDMGNSSSDEDEDKEEIKIVPTYQPRIVAAQSLKDTEFVDPITGKSIPISNMSEHMRIQLLDPKWATERQRFMDKQKESNLLRGQDIAKNISNFVDKKRDEGEDMFGVLTEEEIQKREEDSKKRLEEANRIMREQATVQPPPPPPTATATTVSAPPTLLKRPPPPPLPLDTTSAIQPPLPTEPEPKKPRVTPSTLPPPPPPPVDTSTTTIPQPPILPTTTALPPAPTPTKTILPESEFIATLTSPTLTLHIQIPQTQSTWNLQGQTISLQQDVMSTIKNLKEALSPQLNQMPSNKMQIKFSDKFLKDGMTLAAANVGNEGVLDLVPKVRGGRK